MPFDHDGFFAVMGQYFKSIEVFDGYIDAIETRKGAIQDILETENLTDLYVTLPGIFAGMQSNVTTWINALGIDLQRLFLDRTYVLEQLSVPNINTTSILNAVYNYMIDNSETIEASIITLGGADVDIARTGIQASIGAGVQELYTSRILDGVNAPGNGVAAHLRYSGVESQVARTTTVYAEVTSITAGAETVQLYSIAPATGPYVLEDEEPGTGPAISTAETGNLAGTNFGFTVWSGNEPTGWLKTGGVAPTNYVDESGTGAGPLNLKTTGVKFYKQISNLQRNRTYFVAVYFYGLAVNAATDQMTVGITIRNLADDSDWMSQKTFQIQMDVGDKGVAYGFFILDDDTPLDDVYLEVEFVARTHASDQVGIRKVVVKQATYYNGTAWAWWPFNTTTAPIVVGDRISMAIVNGDEGVFQRNLRKLYNVQFPAADSPTIPDSLAT
jgi:hypothetical protein